MKVKIRDKSGRVHDMHPMVAKAFVDKGRAVYVEEEVKVEVKAPTYQTRALQAAPVQEADPAPYGYKADGTPRKRPGRPAAVESSDTEEGSED